METKLLNNIKDFKNYATDWDNIINTQNNVGVFLSSDWIITWWSEFQNKFRILFPIIIEKNKLIGGLPLYYNPNKNTFEFLSFPVCDYANGFDIVAIPGKEKYVIESCIKLLKIQNFKSTIFKLDMLHENSHLAEFLNSKKSLKFPVLKKYFKRYPKLLLSKDYSNSTTQLSKKFSKRLEYYKRKIKADLGELEIEWHCPKLEDVKFLNILFDLHKNRWHHKNKQETYFISQESINFHRSLFIQFARKKYLRLCYIKIAGKIEGILYGFQFKKKFYFIQHGISPTLSVYSLGHLLIQKAIQSSIEELLSSFEFMKGRQDYKLKWSNSIDKYYTFLFPITSYGLIRLFFMKLKFNIKHILKPNNDS